MDKMMLPSLLTTCLPILITSPPLLYPTLDLIITQQAVIAQTILAITVTIIMIVVGAGCAVKKAALRAVADGMGSGTNSVFASEADADLVGEALPFGLKTMEAIAAEIQSQ